MVKIIYEEGYTSTNLAIWNSFFQDRQIGIYPYDNVILVRYANIFPYTELGIYCTVLPFMHAAALCLSGDELRRVLLIREVTTMIQLLAKGSAWDNDLAVVDFDLSIQCLPDPREVHAGLDQIYPFAGHMIRSELLWRNPQQQAAAREFQQRIKELSDEGEDFSGGITYTLKSSVLELEVYYQTFLITDREIILVQNDMTVGT